MGPGTAGVHFVPGTRPRALQKDTSGAPLAAAGRGRALPTHPRVLGRCKGRRHQRPEQHRGVIFTSPLLKAYSASSLKEVQSAFKKSIEKKRCQGVSDPTFTFQEG